MKKTFSIDDILKPKALKLHSGFVTSTSSSTSGVHAHSANYLISQDKHYAMSIDYHGNQGTIHSRAGQISVGSVPGQHNFTSVIKEHIHRQGVEPPLYQRDSPFYRYSPYNHESMSKEKDICHKRPRSGSPSSKVRMCERFRCEENAFKGREAVSNQGSHQAWHEKQGSPDRKRQDRERQESQGRESRDIEERESLGKRSCQPSPDSSSSFGPSSEEKEGRESVSTPSVSSQDNSHSVIKPPVGHEGASPHMTQSHVSSLSEVEYLGLPAMPHPTYPTPHHIQPQPLPGVCLPLPQVCNHISFKTMHPDLN